MIASGLCLIVIHSLSMSLFGSLLSVNPRLGDRLILDIACEKSIERPLKIILRSPKQSVDRPSILVYSILAWVVQKLSFIFRVSSNLQKG